MTHTFVLSDFRLLQQNILSNILFDSDFNKHRNANKSIFHVFELTIHMYYFMLKIIIVKRLMIGSILQGTDNFDMK